MSEICHNCKSEDTFFDGEVYQCMNCSYMWVSESTQQLRILQTKEQEKKEISYLKKFWKKRFGLK